MHTYIYTYTYTYTYKHTVRWRPRRMIDSDTTSLPLSPLAECRFGGICAGPTRGRALLGSGRWYYGAGPTTFRAASFIYSYIYIYIYMYIYIYIQRQRERER